ncbi:MAG: TolB family protein [Gemmatimonadota bacterium]
MPLASSTPGRGTVIRLASTLLLLAACEQPKQVETSTAGGNAGHQAPEAAALPRSDPSTVVPVRIAPEPGERHLRNLRMITLAGENAEAYFSADGTRLIFQSTRPGGSECDQIYVMDTSGGGVHRISTGMGRTTCAYFFPTGDRVLYSSTHLAGPSCPARPDYSRGYVWALYDYDIFTANPDGSDLRRLTDTPGYDAEATISEDGTRIVFTSVRDGDLEIYSMSVDGSEVRRLTHEEGYDGGPFFSPDRRRIVYRGYHPKDPRELADYQALLAEGLVRPTVMELFIMDADGSHKRQLTHNGAANFAPYFHPNGRQIVFSSNLGDPQSRNFDLYLINLDGTGLERVTTSPEFDAFPMFTRDGRTLVFASNRHDRKPGDTNIFLADWVEDPDVSP